MVRIATGQVRVRLILITFDLIFSIIKPISFKKLRWIGRDRKILILVPFIYFLFYIFIFDFYFYYIKINIFHKKIKI